MDKIAAMNRPCEIAVCLLAETFYPVTGGGETQARVVAMGLLESGHPVLVLTRWTDCELPRDDELDGVRIRRLSPSGHGHLKKWGLCLTALGELIKRRDEYAVIIVCGFRVLGIPAMLARLILGKACVLKADSLGEFSGRFFDPGLARFGLRHDRFPINLAVRLRNLLLRRAERFIAISTAVADELRAGGIAGDRIEMIPNSVDLDRFHPVDEKTKKILRQTLRIPVAGPIAVFTGRLVTTKGLPLLLTVWHRLISVHPNAVLVLVGSGGLGLQNCEAELRSFVQKNALQSNVVFTGSVENVRDYLQASDFFVFPSEREAFGISVAEAMACALPVVTTSIKGLSDVVVEGETARVVPAGDGGALYDAICFVIENEAVAQAMGEAARRRAEQCFSQTGVVGGYLHLVRGLAPKNKRAL
jgi:glycosyltransferase involved in cell wall biosynthesis